MKKTGDIYINLLPPELQRSGFTLEGVALVVLLLLGYALMGYLGYTTSEIKSRAYQENLELVQEIAQYKEISNLVNDISSYQRLVDGKTRQIDMLAAKFMPCTQSLKQIEQSLPRDTVLVYLELTPQEVVLRGFTPGYQSLAQLSSSLASRQGLRASPVIRCEETSEGQVYFDIVIGSGLGEAGVNDEVK